MAQSQEIMYSEWSGLTLLVCLVLKTTFKPILVLCDCPFKHLSLFMRTSCWPVNEFLHTHPPPPSRPKGHRPPGASRDVRAGSKQPFQQPAKWGVELQSVTPLSMNIPRGRMFVADVACLLAKQSSKHIYKKKKYICF